MTQPTANSWPNGYTFHWAHGSDVEAVNYMALFDSFHKHNLYLYGKCSVSSQYNILLSVFAVEPAILGPIQKAMVYIHAVLQKP